MNIKRKRILLIMIIILIISILILTTTIIFLNNKKESSIKNYTGKYEIDYYDEQPAENSEGIEVTKLTPEQYYRINVCINNFVNIINKNNIIKYNDNNENITDNSQSINNIILNLLDKDYISTNNINTNNIRNYIYKIDTSVYFVPIKAKMLVNNKIIKYLVNGYLVRNDNNTLYKEINIFVKTDDNNYTYSITPTDKNDFENISIENNTESIENNDNNASKNSLISKIMIAKLFVKNYKEIMLSNPDIAYTYLDDNYKKEKFETLQKFKNYVNNNKDSISNMEIKDYNYYDKNDGTEQIYCVDNYGKYYVFTYNLNKSPLNYKVYLDTYTINLVNEDSDYTVKITDENKTKLDINKIQSALNNQDYNFIYSKLDDNFKNKYFPSLENFEAYLKENFYDNNVFVYKTLEKPDNQDYYIYTIDIEYAKDTSNFREEKFVVQLKDNYDFVFSFSVQ